MKYPAQPFLSHSLVRLLVNHLEEDLVEVVWSGKKICLSTFFFNYSSFLSPEPQVLNGPSKHLSRLLVGPLRQEDLFSGCLSEKTHHAFSLLLKYVHGMIEF